MKTGIVFQLQQLHAFKELIGIRDKEQKDLKKKEVKLHEYEALKSAGKTETKSTMMSKGKPLAPLMEECATAVDTLKARVQVLSGCLYAHEFDRFDAERSEQYKRLVGMVAVGLVKVQTDVAA